MSFTVPLLDRELELTSSGRLVTSIVGQLTPVVNPFEAVARAFPPGSMTGAPKLRSVRLLEQLEQDKPRGVYAGVSHSLPPVAVSY